MLKVLPALHAISGCDSIISFCGIRQKTALPIFKDNSNHSMAILKFGDLATLHVQDECIETAIRFLCLLYKKTNNVNINDVRFTLFFKKGLSNEKLPPTLMC